MVQHKNSRVCKHAVSPLLLTKMVPLGWHSNLRVLSPNPSMKSTTTVQGYLCLDLDATASSFVTLRKLLKFPTFAFPV